MIRAMTPKKLLRTLRFSLSSSKRLIYGSLAVLLVLPFSAYAWYPTNVSATPGACSSNTINVSWTPVPSSDHNAYAGVTSVNNVTFTSGQAKQVSATINLPNAIDPGGYTMAVGVEGNQSGQEQWYNANVQSYTVSSGSNVRSFSATANISGVSGTWNVFFWLFPNSGNSNVLTYQVIDNGNAVASRVAGPPPPYSHTGLSAGSSHSYTVMTMVSGETTTEISSPAVPATAPSVCSLPDLTAGNTIVTPSAGTAGVAESFSASASNIGNATATNFPNIFQVTDSSMSNTIARVAVGTDPSLTAGGTPYHMSGSYTFNTAGTYNVRACADMNTSGATVISESNTNNNCGAWQSITIATASCANGANNPPTCNACTSPQVWNGSSCVTPSCSVLTSSPSTVSTGGTVTLNWTCNTSSCTAVSNSDGFSTGGSASGSDTAIPTASGTATYGVTCGGSTFYFPPVTVTTPGVTITASPTLVNPGGSTTVSWSSTNTVSCSVTKNGVAWKSGLSSSGVTDSSIGGQTTYAITCQPTGGGSPVTSSTIVNVRPNFQEF